MNPKNDLNLKLARRWGWHWCLALIGFATMVVCNGAGVLRVHPDNPRYFTDDSGQVIYLAGHQWFNDLQYHGWNHSVQVDWDQYLDYLQERNINYVRNWIVWSVGNPTKELPSPLMPFLRTGPGRAMDGRPKFDLTRFNPDYFDRLRSQVHAAEQRHIYMSIMLFEVFGFMQKNADDPNKFWAGNLFNGANNINHIDTDLDQDGQGVEFFFTTDPQILQIQQDYVRKVIDTLNEFDNVFFEIANEVEAKNWQYQLIRFIKDYEQSKPKQHLVYMSAGGIDRHGKWSQLTKNDYLDSGADLYAIAGRWNKDYRIDPPVEEHGRPVIMDMDHVAVNNYGDNEWNNNPATPWKLFTRGYHQCLYDNDYWKPGTNQEQWDLTRRNLGFTSIYARRMDLARMSPNQGISNTRFCLANPGREYLIFQPGQGNIEVRGLIPGKTYDYEWYQVAEHRITESSSLLVLNDVQYFIPPYQEAVLYLKLDEWYKNYNFIDWPWIYHHEHGWQFVDLGSTKESIFVWDLGLGEWIFFNENTYRWMFMFGDSSGWIFTFEDNTPDKRFFQRFDKGSLFSIPPGLVSLTEISHLNIHSR